MTTRFIRPPTPRATRRRTRFPQTILALLLGVSLALGVVSPCSAAAAKRPPKSQLKVRALQIQFNATLAQFTELKRLPKNAKYDKWFRWASDGCSFPIKSTPILKYATTVAKEEADGSV